MRRTSTTALACLALAGALLGAGAAPAAAEAGAGATFSQHVRACQQAMGFSGTHNPGVVHQGLSGWDPSHAC